MIDNRLVGKKISSLRQANGLTQQQLAVMMNVSHQAVSKWESGQALPDIQTMLELTRFFGITVEQLISENEMIEEKQEENAYKEQASAEPMNENNNQPNTEKEVKHMSIQQLLQMAPFMSKETVEEIAMEIEGEITAGQIARLAPYVRPECVEQLIEKHKPELSWESLRRIAPFMSREYVDNLARSIASGKETVKQSADSINKTINDIGKAFDDIGKGVEKAVKKAWRFGESVINEVSSAINDLSSEAEVATAPHVRSDRAIALRKRAFERALADEKWEWIGSHIAELDGDPELRTKIAGGAREAGMNDWICKYMGGYADEITIEAAIQNGSWSWLGDNAWQMEASVQEKVALAAAHTENWEWLANYADQLSIMGCALEIATAALQNGEDNLAVHLAENKLLPADCAELARIAVEGEKWECLARLAALMDAEAVEALAVQLAEDKKWAQVRLLMEHVGADAVEKLMEIAVDQGDFDAVDMLDAHL